MKIKEKDHFNFLCNVGELGSRLAASQDILSFFNEITAMIAKHFSADVCSFYLFDEVSQQLVLSSSYGLAPENIGRISCKEGEDLVGISLKEITPILENQTSSNPHYNPHHKYAIGKYESFLCVPIVQGLKKTGVVVLRAKNENHFSKKDLAAIKATASNLAGLIENARLFLSLQTKQTIATKISSDIPKTTKGHGVSTGIAHGLSYVYTPTRLQNLTEELPPSTKYEISDFKKAIDLTEKELEEMQTRIGKRLPELISLIFDAQLMILKDPLFIGEIQSAIDNGECSLSATIRVGNKYTEMMLSNPDAYVQEKAQDIEDVVLRLIDNIIAPDGQEERRESKGIVIAQHLYASDLLKLAAEQIEGIILVGGGTTAHVSILSRSMGIPMIIVTDQKFLNIPDGTSILFDADNNNIIIKPSIEERKNAKKQNVKKTHLDWKVKPETITQDGTEIKLFANINLLNDVWIARENFASGIGLFRTEIPFLIRSTIPNEEGQRRIYEQVISSLPKSEITIRTFDLGSDKLLASYDASAEANPALGLRSLRFTLKYPNIMEEQLRAILRASQNCSSLRIMFPMVSSIEDFEIAKKVVEKCISNLGKEGISCCKTPSLGIMVETPAAVEIIDVLAEKVNFMCIGTNDLTQFTLAVDRANQDVASYYILHHPAVLRSLQSVIQAGIRFGKPVSICGEMANREEYLPFLLGIGGRHLSIDPRHIPKIQKRIASFTIKEAEELAKKVLKETHIAKINNLFKKFASN